MICPHCKTLWQLPAGSKKSFTKCPFCDGDLYESVDASYTAEMVLKEIVSRFGIEILSNDSELILAFNSMAPHLEKELHGLRLFNACGGVDFFLNLQCAKQDIINTTYTNQVNQMTGVITEICSAFFAAAGLSVGANVACTDASSAPTVEWEYTNFGNGTIEITAFKNQLPVEVIFPSYIDDKKVVSIGTSVFGMAKTKGADRLHVESVFVPQGVTSIGNNVFDGCKSLRAVSLPDGLSSIGCNAFKNCKALKEVTIPDSVTYIGSGAFSGSGIHHIVLPGRIGSVPADGFKKCKKLSRVTILEGVTSVHSEAFYACEVLSSVNLPRGIVSIDRGAFYGCHALRKIDLPDSIKVIEYRAFAWSAIDNETLPSSMTVIEASSFEGCNFSELTIPKGVTQIQDSAFSDCYELRKITIPRSVIKIDNDAFYGIESAITIACYEDSYAYEWAQKHNVTVELIQP